MPNEKPPAPAPAPAPKCAHPFWHTITYATTCVKCGVSYPRETATCAWCHTSPHTPTCNRPSHLEAPASEGAAKASAAVYAQFGVYQRESEFAAGLISLINRHSQENGSNTPDFILAAYLVACLDAFNKASREREAWYGKSLHI